MEIKDKKIADVPPDRPPPYSANLIKPTPDEVPPPIPMRAVVHTMVVQQMGSRSTNIMCKSCNNQIDTRVEFQPTTKTHLFALVLCLIGCWPFACLPYCMDSCNNADHYCPSCNSYIGSYIN